MTYNGWSNYETWAVGMYLDSNYDEGAYHEALEIARTADSLYDLAGALQAFVEESLPDLGASIAADLLNAAMSEVDWHELAENLFAEGMAGFDPYAKSQDSVKS